MRSRRLTHAATALACHYPAGDQLSAITAGTQQMLLGTGVSVLRAGTVVTCCLPRPGEVTADVYGPLHQLEVALDDRDQVDLVQARRQVADQLEAALASRSVIDQALGIVMGRAGCGPEEAFERLKKLSQREHLKLSEVARHLVSQAAARAPARHSAGSAKADATAQG